MASNSPHAYPAEYYYPEFIDSRPEDPLKSPQPHFPISTSIDNGISSSIKVDSTNETTIKKKPINKKQTTTGLALDVVTDHGLPDADITQTLKTDPKKNLVRDPAERNIPRLIVDDSIIKQTVRAPKIVTTNLDDDLEQTKKSNQINNGKKSIANGHVNEDLTNKARSRELQQYYQQQQQQQQLPQQTIQYVEDEPPIDDYWKKEVLINDEGVVTIEPVKYDRNKYDGPFGLTRQGSYIFYISLAILTILAAVFLIMTGVFYGRSYPDSSGNTGKLAGIGICALAFYLGLMLILIGLWHQKHRQENPTHIVQKPTKHNESATHLKSSMEENVPYDYSYQQQYDYAQQQQQYDYTQQQQQYDYTPYENYSNPPYTSNTNEQLLLQQPGAATGAAYYDPVVWPSNVELEAQPDSKFYQPMEWSLGTQQANEIQSTAPFPPPAPVITNKNKPEKKKHHHNKKTIETNPPKPKFDNLFPNSTVTEQPLPVLNKAPETTELIRTIADMEKNKQQNPTAKTLGRKNSNRIQPKDRGSDSSSYSSRQHHHGDRHRRHSHHHHYRRHSYSTCSTCSDSSYDAFHSDVGFHHQHQYSEPVHKTTTPRTYKARTPSPPRTHRSTHRTTGMGTERSTILTRDSGMTTTFERVPNVRDDRLEQIPVVRRTIIVEPYPAEPTSKITVKPRTDMIGKTRLSKNEKLPGNKETVVYPSTTLTNQKFKTKKSPIGNNGNTMEDLTLEDVNDDHTYNNDDSTKSKKKRTNKTLSSKSAKNAFYN